MPPQNRKRPVTMADVAKQAQVSRTTVSFVINNIEHANIPEETRERVWQAVQSLGYRPNAFAKSLRTQRSNAIGLITDQIASTPFAGNVILGAQEAAWDNQKILLMVNTGGNAKLEEAAVESMLERQVEGIIYAAWYHRAVELPNNIREVPTVLVDCFTPDRSLPSVVPDEYRAGRDATEKLLSKGHRRVAFINMSTMIPAGIGRLQGYRDALAAYDVPFDETLVRPGTGQADSGYEETMALLRSGRRPTAIFCGNDRMAMGAYQAIHERRLKIPDHIAVVSIDNQELIAAYLRPPLSTMALPHYEMGHWAVEHLVSGEAAANRAAPIQHTIACAYIERLSL